MEDVFWQCFHVPSDPLSIFRYRASIHQFKYSNSSITVKWPVLTSKAYHVCGISQRVSHPVTPGVEILCIPAATFLHCVWPNIKFHSSHVGLNLNNTVMYWVLYSIWQLALYNIWECKTGSEFDPWIPLWKKTDCWILYSGHWCGWAVVCILVVSRCQH